ncbi:MAG: hypothetical protein QOH41_443 [Blastocatellia bacterium]|nr:hypothetical protein [Blastocatellia bacterium]
MVPRVGSRTYTTLRSTDFKSVAAVLTTSYYALPSSIYPGEGLNPLDKNNPWAFFDHYIDRVAAQCVNTLTPKWSTKLGGFDVYVWDQCYSMEQTLRIE